MPTTCKLIHQSPTSAFKSSSTQSLLGSLEKDKDKYQYCLFTCRTDSKSVVNENQFMSEFRYHCDFAVLTCSYCYSSRSLDRQFLPSSATTRPNLAEDTDDSVNGEDEDILNEFENLPKETDTNSDALAQALEEKKRELEELGAINKKLQAEREKLTELLKQAQKSQRRTSEPHNEDEDDEISTGVSFPIFHTFVLIFSHLLLKWMA